MAGGRQIAIPLSGGYDSRAIALYLKKSGYKNLVCFTFGKQSSHEVAMSRRIADALDIEWHNVEYTKDMWKKIKKSDDFSEYIDRISSGVSVANVQVYPAIKTLLENGVIDAEAIVVPGHAADFVAGSHFKEEHLSSVVDFHALTYHIAKKHYKHKPFQNPEQLIKKISHVISDFTCNNNGSKSFISLAECWNSRERQSKFIANSNRYYDFWGLNWWMPFWDNEFVTLWEKVPYELRLNTELWNEFVNKKMLEFAGSAAPYGRSDPKRNIFQKIKNRLNYFTDPNGLYALVPFDRWLFFTLKLSKKSGTVFGVLSESYIKNLGERLGK